MTTLNDTTLNDTTLNDPLVKYSEHISNSNNNIYRSIRKISLKESGLSESDILKLLNKQENLFRTKEKSKAHCTPEISTRYNSIKDDITENIADSPLHNSIDGTNYGTILTYRENYDLIRKINQLSKEKVNKVKKVKIMKWYKSYRYELNKIFKDSMNFFIDEKFEFTMSNKDLYNSFIEYSYDNYMLSHI